MISRKPAADSGAGAGESASSNARLRREIEALSRALSLDSRPRSKPNPKPKPEPEPNTPAAAAAAAAARRSPPPLSSSSSSSFWGWKPLRALSHLGRRRFEVVFTLHVHSISSLPPPLAAPLAVRWKRSTDPASAAASTQALPAAHGVAEFDEVLTYRASVYAARDAGGVAKYEAKHFLIWAAVADAPSLDLGKHTVDLTRLLPLAMDKLGGDDDGDDGRWTTSFRLAGKAKGASLKVTFGFSLATPPGPSRKNSIVRKPSVAGRSAGLASSVEVVKVLHEVLPSLTSPVPSINDVPSSEFGSGNPVPGALSINFKSESESDIGTEEPKTSLSTDHKNGDGNSPKQEPEFMVIEQGVEFTEGDDSQDKDKLVGSRMIGAEDANTDVPCNEIDRDRSSRDDSAREDLDIAPHGSPSRDSENIDPLQLVAEDSILPNYTESRSEYNGRSMNCEPTNFDNITENEFLSMIGIPDSPLPLSSENDPESPRERLWKQFQEDALATNANSLFGFEMGAENEDDAYASYDDFELSSLVLEAECELQKATQEMDSKSRAEMLESAETEALMREFGLDEKAFHRSPSSDRGGFSSPECFPMEEVIELPPLGDGLGPFVQTKDGGFVRSMNPSLFRNARNNGNLVMQVSSPVVVPAEMGDGVMEVLQRLASLGVEKLSMQATKLMPLEDITGKTMQQVAWETSPVLEAQQRQEILQHKHGESETRQFTSDVKEKAKFLNVSRKGCKDVDSEYVSLDDLAPLAMDKIEALSIEGLRIQSGMSTEEAPANISALSMGELSAFEGKEAKNRMTLGLEGAGGLQLLNIKDNGDEIDGLMGLSITLDEWMKLDSGIVDEEDNASDRTSKILAAHHATSADLIGGWKGERTGGKRSGRRWGLLGNNFTVALMVQLRDPLRNFETVGTPMLALIQVERVFVPPKPKVYCTVSEKGNSEQDDESESNKGNPVIVEEKKEDEMVPQFQITEVHVAGLKAEPDKKTRDSSIQQQSGSRWLLATGMGKKNKNLFGKSKTAQSGDTLWSISSRARGPGAKWNLPAALNRGIRNPNIIFS